MSCGTAARPGSITTITTTTEQSVFHYLYENKRRRHQPKTQDNSRRTAAAAADVAAAAEAVRCGWRRQWRLQRQHCGIATVVDKISTEHDITQQQRPRSHRKKRGSADSLAVTPEIARTRHASTATLCGGGGFGDSIVG